MSEERWREDRLEQALRSVQLIGPGVLYHIEATLRTGTNPSRKSWKKLHQQFRDVVFRTFDALPASDIDSIEAFEAIANACNWKELP